MFKNELSIILVNYNTRDLLKRCLSSILSDREDCKDEIIVVDNASKDGSTDMLRSEFTSVTVIANSENAGFGRACNQAIMLTRGEYILLLNPDTVVIKGAISELLAFMKGHGDAGIAGPKLYLNAAKDFHPSVRTFTNPLNIFMGFMPLSGIIMKIYHQLYFNKIKVRKVDWLWGAALMLRRSMLEKVGLFDEAYFLYSEEEDLCRRACQQGFSIYYVPPAEMIHWKERSGRQQSPECHRYFWESKMLYLKKYTSPASILLFKIYFGLLIRVKMFFGITPKDGYHREILRALATL